MFLSHMRTGWAVACVLGASIALFTGEVRAQSVSVSIQGFDFVPGSIVVVAGSTVTWTHDDGNAGHNVSLPGVFRSPGMYQGETFSQTFDSPGSYTYGCSLHPTLMTGTVTVVSTAQDLPVAPTATIGAPLAANSESVATATGLTATATPSTTATPSPEPTLAPTPTPAAPSKTVPMPGTVIVGATPSAWLSTEPAVVASAGSRWRAIGAAGSVVLAISAVGLVTLRRRR